MLYPAFKRKSIFKQAKTILFFIFMFVYPRVLNLSLNENVLKIHVLLQHRVKRCIQLATRIFLH